VTSSAVELRYMTVSPRGSTGTRGSRWQCTCGNW